MYIMDWLYKTYMLIRIRERKRASYLLEMCNKFDQPHLLLVTCYPQLVSQQLCLPSK